VVPEQLLDAVADKKDLADCGTARIEQRAFADFLARPELDRHLRRMRAQYRPRRDLLVEALGNALPEATIRGIAAGLHATVELPGDYDEQAILAEAHARSIDLTTMGEFWIEPGSGPPTLLNISMFWSLAQARVVISDWKADYNHRRRHSALGYQAPAVYGCSPHPSMIDSH
jgi:GntR family transcriptional regulator / MocR family aminotransferase